MQIVSNPQLQAFRAALHSRRSSLSSLSSLLVILAGASLLAPREAVPGSELTAYPILA